MVNGKFELTDEIINKARASISKLADNLIKLKMEDIESYEFPLDEKFALEIIHEDAPFYLIIKFASTNKNIICMAPGAFRRDKVTSDGKPIDPPHFHRWRWPELFDESVIVFADPMIFWDENISIGWMIGDANQWYIETLSEIIKKLAKNQNVINDNILFFGSSGGGFISVCLATLIKHSKVLVNNSQFSILNYKQHLVKRALDLITPTFNGLTQDEVIEKIKYRIDTPELFKRENYAPYITYYVNVKSEIDIQDHSIPLIQDHFNQEQFRGLDVIFYSEDKEIPHHPFKAGLMMKVIDLFAKNNLYNSEPNVEERIILRDRYQGNCKYTFEKLKEENEELKKKNLEMETSTSWKITAPLRKIMRTIRRKN